MQDIPELVDGYRHFHSDKYPGNATLYRTLGETGQSPKTMVISCCDSRVDPEAIFNAAPGELFVVRNVANLAPPCTPLDDYHGTGAALEFAVTGLKVENIVVMGHAQCGGVKGFIEGANNGSAPDSFVGRWVSLIKAGRTSAVLEDGSLDDAQRQRAVEHASVRQSLENLETFPFIKERVADGRLRLRGAYFDIAEGALWALDPVTDQFVPLE